MYTWLSWYVEYMKVIASKLSSLQKNMPRPHSKTFYVENVWLAGKSWQTWHFKVQKPLVLILLHFGHVYLSFCMSPSPLSFISTFLSTTILSSFFFPHFSILSFSAILLLSSFLFNFSTFPSLSFSSTLLFFSIYLFVPMDISSLCLSFLCPPPSQQTKEIIDWIVIKLCQSKSSDNKNIFFLLASIPPPWNTLKRPAVLLYYN